MWDYLSFRRLIRKFESLHIQRKNSLDMSRWRESVSPTAKYNEINAHIMLVRDVRYVKLAEICVISFLHFHPKAIITLHCDEPTLIHAKNTFHNEIDRGNVKVRALEEKNHRDWQEQKLELILAMSGTKDILLDADLRWNGAISESIDKVFFLVMEFELRDKSPFREIASLFDFLPQDSSMKNVSVFTFGGYQLTKKELTAIRSTMDTYREIIDSPTVGKLDKVAVGRVIEQFALSACSETWNIEISYIKESDAPMDGGIVESCYFGATGGTF